MSHISQNEKAVLFLLYTLTNGNPHKSSQIATIVEHLIQDVREGLDPMEFVGDVLMKLAQDGLTRVDPHSPTAYQITGAGIDKISRLLADHTRT